MGAVQLPHVQAALVRLRRVGQGAGTVSPGRCIWRATGDVHRKLERAEATHVIHYQPNWLRRQGRMVAHLCNHWVNSPPLAAARAPLQAGQGTKPGIGGECCNKRGSWRHLPPAATPPLA